MAKTRAQTLRPIIKKEVREEKTSLVNLPHATNNASKNKTKITKYKTIETWVDISPRFVLFKSNSININRLNSLPYSIPTLRKRATVTKEQITKLIQYIEKDKTSIKGAARKTGMSEQTAHRYYQKYRYDPQIKIPSEGTSSDTPPPKLTQKKIEEAIHYIVHDGMSVAQASFKANLSKQTVDKYYKKYLEDPEHKIPMVYNISDRIQKDYTQEQINQLIDYITKDRMSVPDASRKVHIDPRSGKRYYLKYMDDPYHRIPIPGRNVTRSSRGCTNEQVKSLIGYIANDRMTLLEASVKADMGQSTAKKYYKQYLADPEHKIPTPEYNYRSNKLPSVKQVKKFFNYVIVDKMNIPQACCKTNITDCTGYIYYNRYVKNPTKEPKIKDTSYSVEKMKKMIDYVQKDKMTLRAAAEKAELVYITGMKYYRQYMKNPELGIPVVKVTRYTQEDIRRLIHCIESNNISILAAARKINMNASAANKYYRIYKNDPEHTIPVPNTAFFQSKCKIFDQYSKIVADIYKNNPSIKPIHENRDSKFELPDIYIKQENFE